MTAAAPLLLRLFFLLLLFAPLRADMETFYLGTYTSHGGSEGIYRGTLDPATGKLGPVKLAVAVRQDPTFLVASHDGKFIYAGMSDAVAAFAVQPDGTLREINRRPAGHNSCHVCLDRTGHELFSASYDEGSVSAFPVNADGSIGAEITRQKLTGSGPNLERQKSAHAHSVDVDPENRFLYTCDLGSDRIWIFRIGDGGALVPADPPYVPCAPGIGPRHLAFLPNSSGVAVVNELGVSTSWFWRNAKTGELHAIETLPNVDPGWPPRTGSAEIVVDSSGHHVYVSTRKTDRLTLFQKTGDIATSGVNPVVRDQVIDSPVHFSRSFALDPSGRWLVVAGETDSRIAVVKVDPKNGRLSPTDQTATVATPVCVLFVPTAPTP